MKKILTEKELAEELKKITVICDTREQRNEHVIEYFDKKKIPHIDRALGQGDYSFQVDGVTFADEIVVERKANLDELCGNITADRKRIENEFARIKASGIKCYFIVENASFEDIEMHNYRSKLAPKSLFATIMAWQVRYNLTIIFCQPAETGWIMHGLFYYHYREVLKT